MAINLKGIKNVDKDKLINSTKKDIDILYIKGVAELAKETNPTALSADIVAYYASNSSSDGIRPNSDNRTDTGSMVTSSSGGGGTSFATAETAADSNTPKADELAAEDFKKNDAALKKKLNNLGISYGEDESNEITINGNSSDWETYSNISDDAATKLYRNFGKSLNGIFGSPYQFSEIVDQRVSAGDGELQVGRKYTEKILANAPLLFLSVGTPEFLGGASKAKKKRVASDMISMIGGGDAQALNENDYTSGRFYSFVPDMVEYQQYFNTAARSLAILMGIGNKKIAGTSVSLSNMRLDNLFDDKFRQLAGAMYSIPFFVEAENSISESFSNSTTQSVLEGLVDQPSQVARQAQFLLGTHDIGGLAGAFKNVGENIMNGVADVGGNILEGFGEVLAGRGLINKLKNEFTTIASGGKMIFPEIWDSSSFSRSYSINMKLRAPDPDPYSIFMNIYVPILLWVTAAAPHQMNNSATSYTSPFIVRATYKSMFACDAGIISNVSITKASEDKWNGMGMPISVDLTVDIKDLYSTMFISKAQGIVNNTAQLDYLALMAGVDMNDIDARRTARILGSIYKNKPMDMGRNLIASAQQSINTNTRGVLRKLFKSGF
nr:MAG TPA: hypothetical protein [Caudoviricetes sp.]